MRIIFIGCVSFSKSIIETLLKLKKANIVGVITKSSSSFNSDFIDLSHIAIENNIPYKYTKDINSFEILDWIKDLNADIIYCMGWSSLIKENLLNATSKGVIGYHPALLPQNRGRHPIIWSLALGLKKTGSTFFKMDSGADSGDIIIQDEVIIEFDDYALDLYNKLINTAKKQVQIITNKLASSNEKYIIQDNSKANYWRKRTKKDGEINFSSNTLTIFDLIKSLSKPYPGAHILYKNEDFKVWRSKMGDKYPVNIEPGKVLKISDEGNILVKTGDGSIWIIDHEITILPKINSYLL